MENWLLVGLLFLACPVSMGAAMWFMMRMNRGQATDHAGMPVNATSPQERLALLEAEKLALERQIAATNGTGAPTETSTEPVGAAKKDSVSGGEAQEFRRDMPHQPRR